MTFVSFPLVVLFFSGAKAFVPPIKQAGGIPGGRASSSSLLATPDSFADIKDKLELLQDNLSNVASPSFSLPDVVVPDVSSLMDNVDLDGLDLAQNGPWALAVAAVLIGVGQRSAASEEAKKEIIEKIARGELSLEEEQVCLRLCASLLPPRVSHGNWLGLYIAD